MPIVLCAQLPASRLVSYGAFSVLIAIGALWRYVNSDPQENVSLDNAAIKRSILTVEMAMQDNYVVVATFNMVLYILIACIKGFQHFFFGPLVGAEPQFIREKMTHFALSRAVFLVGVINATKWSSLLGWTLWFSCLSCLIGFTRLARPRCEQLTARTTTSRSQWCRFSSLLIILTFGTMTLLSTGLNFRYYLSDVTPESDVFGNIGNKRHPEPISQTEHDGGGDLVNDQTSEYFQVMHVLIFMVSDSLLVLMLLIQVAIVIAIHKLDGTEWMRQKLSFDKAVWLYNINTTFDLCSLALDFTNHVHMLIWSHIASLTSIVVVLQLFISYGELSQRMRRHIAYRNLVAIVRREFPLEHIDQKAVNVVGDGDDPRNPEPEMCAICWELLWTWRKLSCQHCFHETCITMWMEQDSTCPTCRRAVLSQTQNHLPPASRRPPHPQTPSVSRSFREFLNLFDSTNNQPTAAAPHHRARAVRGMAVRLRQRGGTPAGQTAQPPGPSLDLSIRVRLGSIRQPTIAAVAPNSEEDPRTDTGEVVQQAPQQPQVMQSTVRSRYFHFDGANYLSWLPTVHIELSESEQHLSPVPVAGNPASPGTTTTPVLEPNIAPSFVSRVLAYFRPSASNPTDYHADGRYDLTPPSSTTPTISASLRAQANQIAAMFPAIPLDDIVADLAQTRVAEITVDNILRDQMTTAESHYDTGFIEDLTSSDDDIELQEESTFEFEEELAMHHPLTEPSVVRQRTNTNAHQTSPTVEQNIHPSGSEAAANETHPLWEIDDATIFEEAGGGSSASPSCLIAHRRQQMLLKARQRFLADRQHPPK